MEKLRGTVSGIIFQNDETGYRVVDVESDEGTYETVTGIMPPLFSGEIIEAEGEWNEHSNYGRQFKASAVTLSLPSTTEGMRAFLASGLIPGIGPGLASRIVGTFGSDTFDVISERPEALERIQGITLKKVRKIKQAFDAHRESSDTVMFFAGFGVGTGVAMEAYRRFGDGAREIIKENPYSIIGVVGGYGFGTADRIAITMGFAPDSPQRIRAYILHILGSSYGEGHVFLFAKDIRAEIAKTIDITDEDFEEALDNLESEERINRETVKRPGGESEAVYLHDLYEAERGIEEKLQILANVSHDDGSGRAEKLLKAFEKENDITLDDEQKKAVLQSSVNGVTVITGGPGTGKTTIIKALIRILEERGIKTVLCAPTGRAAKRMATACGEQARTIHRLLEPDFKSVAREAGVELEDRDIKFKRNASNPLEAGCVIVDEMSMVDTLLMYNLVNALRYNTMLVLVGDNNQLPSVGPGRVLRDIIKSGLFETIKLENIYRQNPDSLISYNAHLVNNGKMPEMNREKGDFFRMSVRSPKECIELLKSLVSERLPNRYGIDPFTDIQVITPNRKGQCGSQIFSAELQSILNPPLERGKTTEIKNLGEVLRVGDRVMHTKNDYELEWADYDDPSIEGQGVFNGEMGRIEAIDTTSHLVYVLFGDNRYVCYDRQSLSELELCYAITVHKSQGSEFDYCIIPICNVTPSLMTRNLLYTAITRAKKMAIILGTDDSIAAMIANNREVRRNTTLFRNNTIDW
ncbi:MAG: ATP-dependent RecD-like DNA helicase [Clostridia bacterium]|nr:ATP-dependent RecD-like DNA helicase [Clostridia bacterium]